MLQPVTDAVTSVCAFTEDRELQGEHVTIYLFNDVSLLKQVLEYKGDWIRSQADDWALDPWPVVAFSADAIIVGSSDPGLDEVNTVEHWVNGIAENTVHAMFHRSTWEGQGPEWLSEGMADLVHRMATAWAGEVPYEHDHWRRFDAEDAGPDLKQLGEGWGYAAGLEAAELIVSHTGIEAFAEFYSNLRGRESWQQVFEDAFGLSVDQFYEQYDAHWNWGLPDLHIALTSTEVQAWQPPIPPPSPEEQRQILTEFYNATGGNDWTNNTGWLSDAPLDDWHGVGTDMQGNVIELRLPDNNLTGNLPVPIAGLPKISQLYLPENKLSGQIPAEIGQLASLGGLDLRGNRLTGTIPPEIGNLKQLHSLELGGNELTGSIPPEIGELIKLISLGLDVNNLTGEIPVEIGKLTALAWLELSSNKLSGSIPKELGDLKTLNHLGLEANELTGSVPTELGRLTDLTWLGLSSNKLTGTIPTELENLTNLELAYVAGNEFQGCIPASLRRVGDNDFRELAILYCGSNPSDPDDRAVLVKLYNATNGDEWHNNENWLSEQPLAAWHGVDVDAQGKVTALELGENNLNGVLIPEIGLLDSLESLQLRDNSLSGPIPSETGNLKQLTSLGLARNKLNGTIPPIIWDLTALRVLGLDGNNLTGTIPTEIENLTNLTWLALGSNQLTGVIPIEIGNLKMLDTLGLERNEFSGNIPKEVGQLAGLTWLDLSWNKLTGIIPIELGMLTNLEHVYVAGNGFEDCIPESWRHSDTNDFSELDIIYCGDNPSDPEDRAILVKLYNAANGDEWHDNEYWLSDKPLAAWHGVDTDAQGKVTRLELWWNNLNGTLIPEIAQLDQLTSLDLNGNELSGQLPSEIGNLERLEALKLSYNNLGGQIPVGIAELNKLGTLDLADNEISGPIPAVIGKLTNLEYLYLAGNGLSGTIPQQLSSLANLSTLSLASNKLTGEVPAWIGDLEELKDLTLSDNQFTGDVSTFSGHLDGLTTLSIAGNDLSGCLHPTLRNIEETDFIFSRLNYCDQPPKQPPTTPTFIKWEVGDAVRTPEERAARLGVQWLFEYAESIGWPIVGDDITVYFKTLEPLVYASAIEDGTIDEGEIESQREFISGIGGFAHEDSNFNRATEVGDSIDRWSMYSKASLLIHENIHTAFQVDIEGLSTSPSLVWYYGGGSPAWFTEGMATYYESLITSFHSGETDILCRECEIEVEVDGITTPLEEIHLSSAEDSLACAYTCGAFAIELLASMVGQRHIVDFYTLRRPGRTWQETFEDVFGISVPDFYALYDQHRDAGFPELNPPVESPTGPETEAVTEQLPDNRDDRSALIAFYNSTRGDSWHDNTNWNSNEPLASWYGVSIDASGRVQGLSLSENRLRGVIPQEIGNLTNLKWLYLNGNEIRSAIPEAITQLTNLEDLWLGENQLGGTIPDDIDNMSNLQFLVLDNNDIAGRLPASLMSLSNLRYLNLERNDLSGPIPENLGDLKSLEVLNLGQNRLTQNLPNSVGRLSNLRELAIWSNRLSGNVPAALGNLSKLEIIRLEFNRLSGHLPATLGNLRNLSDLFLGANRLTGPIPEDFSNMTNLVDIHLSGNQLSGQFPAWLAELENTFSLYLAGNSFTGCIPPDLFVDVEYHDLEELPLRKCN